MARTSRLRDYRSAFRYAGDIIFDRLFGVDTAGHVHFDELDFDENAGLHYEPSNWINLILLRMTLKSMRIGEYDVFIDFGCGKGQVLLVAAMFPFGRVIGLDISPTLLEIAKRNLDANVSRLRCRNVQYVCEDVRGYPIPPDVNICYFYNPFPRDVLDPLARRIVESADEHARRVSVLSLRGKMDDVFERSGFTLTGRSRRLRTYTYEPPAQRGHGADAT